MLTPVTPNPIATSTTIKSHGSETRTAAGQNTAEAGAPPAPQAHMHGIGLDAGTILANVNAEAATAGNRTILQSLALAVAVQLNLSRREDESMEAFFQRIASALEDMTPDEQATVEIRAGLKILRIEIPALAAALKQPDSALAARLAAAAETPLATPLKTTAATVTTNYLQEAPGVSRAAETLAMVAQAHSNTEGGGIFSSASAAALPEPPPADAHNLQSQLKSLFEPGVAETRMEIASKVEVARTEPMMLGNAEDLPETIAGTTADDDLPPEKPDTARQSGANGAAKEQPAAPLPLARRLAQQPAQEQLRLGQADPMPHDAEQPDMHAAETEARQVPARLAQLKPAGADLLMADAKPMPALQEPEAHSEQRAQSLPVPQSNNATSTSQHLRAIARDVVQERVQRADARTDNKAEHSDHRVQTMLMKSLAEAFTTLPSKAAELLMNAQANGEAHPDGPRQKTAPAMTLHDAGKPSQTAMQATAFEIPVHKDKTVVHHPAPAIEGTESGEEDIRATQRRGNDEQMPATRTAEQHQAAGVKPGLNGAEAVPFGYVAVQPAKEEFLTEATEESGRHEDEEQAGEEQEAEDEETRRERLARKATDELLRLEPEAEPDLKITRDSSQADRAYALYQRMAGF